MTTQKTLEAILQQFDELKKQLNHTQDLHEQRQRMSESRFLKFNEKEIFKMPKTFRKEFRVQGCTAHVRKRSGGRYKCSYEIRYDRNGYHISASATTLDKAKERFIQKLIDYEATGGEKNNAYSVPRNFHDFAMYWFENFHKRKVKHYTYEHNLSLYNRHIKQRLEKYDLKRISPYIIQQILDCFSDKERTAEDIYSILSQILSTALKHGCIRFNPIEMCFHKQHKREHGKAILFEDERKLLNAFNGQPFQIYFATILYTGLRPNEYPTAVIEGKFIKAINSKRKNGITVYKKIPISPMLKPYLQNIKGLNIPPRHIIDKRFKKVLPDYKLYDMRTTFQTRCSECGIPDNVIGVFMGNSIGKLKDAYTDFSDEYLLKEGEKLNY